MCRKLLRFAASLGGLLLVLTVPHGAGAATDSGFLKDLSAQERRAVRAACVPAQNRGRAAFRRCVQQWAGEMRHLTGRGYFSQLRPAEQAMVFRACRFAQGEGMKVWRRCVKQRSEEARAVRRIFTRSGKRPLPPFGRPPPPRTRRNDRPPPPPPPPFSDLPPWPDESLPTWVEEEVIWMVDEPANPPSQEPLIDRNVPRDLAMAVQKRLADLGFNPGMVDGLVGSRTQAAVRAFQRVEDLPVTGRVTESLLAHLNEKRRTDRQESAPIVVDGLDLGRFHALVIGNDTYSSLEKLRTARADARALGGMLESLYGFSVTLLIDATRDAIIRALDGYRRDLGSDDNLLIYYAGHGWLDRDSERGYWLPVDAAEQTRTRWLSNADITDSLKAIQARRVMVVADSCYSGALTRGLRINPRSGDSLEKRAAIRSRTVMTSGGLEPVIDGGGGGHSVFAKSLMDVLRGSRGVVDGSRVFARVRDKVTSKAAQTPRYVPLSTAGHEAGGDFLFVRR